MKYLFHTTATMKESNRYAYWINADYIGEIRIDADTLADALEQWKEHAEDAGANISKSAMRHKSPMFIDTKAGSEQAGFVITASTDFFNESRGIWTKQYIDLWVSIEIIAAVDFAAA